MENLKLNRQQMNETDLVAYLETEKNNLEKKFKILLGEQTWIRLYIFDAEPPIFDIGKKTKKNHLPSFDYIFYHGKRFMIIKNGTKILGITEHANNPRMDCLYIKFNTL